MATRLFRLSTLLAAAVAATLLAGHLQAASIGVQFAENSNPLAPTDTAGFTSVAQANWNVLTGTTFAAVSLSDSTPTMTTATITGSGGGGYFAGNSFPPGGNHTLLSAALLSTGSRITETISNIPYAYYDVYVYGTCDNDTRELSIQTATATQTENESFTTTTASSTFILATETWDGTGTRPTDPQANYAYFSELTGSTLTLSWYSPDNAGINGFQIVEVGAPVPEPASLGLLAVGAVALLRRRRRA